MHYHTDLSSRPFVGVCYLQFALDFPFPTGCRLCLVTGHTQTTLHSCHALPWLYTKPTAHFTPGGPLLVICVAPSVGVWLRAHWLMTHCTFVDFLFYRLQWFTAELLTLALDDWYAFMHISLWDTVWHTWWYLGCYTVPALVRPCPLALFLHPPFCPAPRQLLGALGTNYL